MRLFKIIIRSNRYESTEFRFDNDIEAANYFYYLVNFELDGLFESVWSITLLHGKKVLRNYSNYLNVKH